MVGLNLSPAVGGESLATAVQGLGTALTGGGEGGAAVGAAEGALGAGGHSLQDAIGQVTGGGRGLFTQAKANAANFMNANSVEGAIQAAKGAILDPHATQNEMIQNAFGGLRRMAGSGMETLVGDLVAGSPGSGSKVDTLFENFTQQFIGKVAPGVSALTAAEKAKQAGMA